MEYFKKYKFIILGGVLVLVLVVLSFLIKSKEVESIEVLDEVFNDEVVDTIKIEVKGAVLNTGVFEIDENARVIDAINLVGGVLKKADTSNINLSAKLTDAMVLDIPYKEESDITIKVDIKGCVNKPGVYEMNSNDRVIDVILKSGNLSECADTSSINLSKKIFDEMVIIIPEIKEDDSITEENNDNLIDEDENNNFNDALIGDEQNKESNDNEIKEETEINKKISINTASKEELMTLSGIGESKALDIIEYRNNKLFESIEEITNVSGIGNALFEKIKDNITL